MLKRDRWNLVLLGAVIILLPIAAALQYRWLGRVSEAEHERMRAVLRSAASQFGESFDREITRAYALFQHQGGSDFAQIPGQYALRLDEWRASAAYPEMLRDIFVVTADPAGATQLMRYDEAARRFQSIEWPDELAVLRDPHEIAADYLREKVPALVIPTERETGILCTIVTLDRDRISASVLPALAARYFGDRADASLQYDVAVVSRDDPAGVIFATATELTRASETADAAITFNDVRIDTLPIRTGPSAVEQRNATHSTTLLRVIKRRIGPAADDERGGRWQLLVRHRSGSLELAVAAARQRNLAISFAVLFLLGVGVAFIVISSRRATRLAEDQLKFVAGVTHELRTPLAVICSAGENLADGLVDQPAKTREYGSVIRDEGRRLSRMVEQVLEYAGAQYGRSAYNLQPTDLRSVIDTAVNDARVALENGSFQLECEINEPLPPVSADGAALQRALQNLLSNAAKYDRGERWIKISARADRGAGGAREVRITVEDRGSGIPKADLPHIFEPFFRGPDVVAAQVKGTGLGLSLVRHVVAAHGGRVSVESSVRRGSAFTIHLPVSDQR